MKKFSFKDRKSRIILLSVPMFLLPLALLAFSIMSGLQGNEPLPEPQLNSTIPKADGKANLLAHSKWKTYENQSGAKDWVHQVALFPEDTVPVLSTPGNQVESMLFPVGTADNHDKLIEEQLQKLEYLQKQLEGPQQKVQDKKAVQSPDISLHRENPAEIQKLEQLMQKMEEKRALPDPELLQLENLLDKA